MYAVKDSGMDYIDQLIWEKHVLIDGLNEIFIYCMNHGHYDVRKIALETFTKLYLPKPETE